MGGAQAVVSVSLLSVKPDISFGLIRHFFAPVATYLAGLSALKDGRNHILLHYTGDNILCM